jgi:hypothetical protein
MLRFTTRSQYVICARAQACFPTIRYTSHKLFHTRSFVNEKGTITSPQQQGFLYENEAVSTLNDHYNFEVKQSIKSGGPGDKGIDFKGTFTVDSQIPIIGQCKRLKKPLSVEIVREFEGVLSHYVSNKFVGLFVSFSGYSQEAVKHAQQSLYPIILSIIRNGAIQYWVMNQSASALFPTLVPALHRRTDGSDKIIFFKQKDGVVIPLESNKNAEL